MLVLPPTPTEAGTGASGRPTGAPPCQWGRPGWLWVCPQVGSPGHTPLHTATATSRTLPFYVEHGDCSPSHTLWGKLLKDGAFPPWQIISGPGHLCANATTHPPLTREASPEPAQKHGPRDWSVADVLCPGGCRQMGEPSTAGRDSLHGVPAWGVSSG